MIFIRLEQLGSGITAIVSDKHSFGTDALLLAYFATPKPAEKVCDLGTGCGIIPLLWCRDKRQKNITAIDIQPDACEQVQKAIELNSIENTLEVINADLRELKGVVPFGVFDTVTMNPPYKAANAGKKSADNSALIARHEVMCNLDDILLSAKKLLKFSGRFCLCHRPERLGDIFCLMRKHSIEPKRLRLVCRYEGVAPWLVLVEGRKGGKPGLKIEPSFIIMQGEDYSEEMKKVYGEYLDSTEQNK
ncbi:MAG TPA: methyltransferase [Clostridia bacterium]|nr:methyltransferase [Clostridia bacterium]